MNPKVTMDKNGTVVEMFDAEVENPDLKKSEELYIKGVETYEKGQKHLSQYKQLLSDITDMEKEIDEIYKKISHARKAFNRHFVKGHDLLDKAKKIWKESEELAKDTPIGEE